MHLTLLFIIIITRKKRLGSLKWNANQPPRQVRSAFKHQFFSSFFCKSSNLINLFSFFPSVSICKPVILVARPTSDQIGFEFRLWFWCLKERRGRRGLELERTHLLSTGLIIIYRIWNSHHYHYSLLLFFLFFSSSSYFWFLFLIINDSFGFFEIQIV